MLTLLLLFNFPLQADTHTILIHKGEKIAQLMCDYKKLHSMHVNSPDEAKAQILSQKLCKPLSQQKLEAVSLWITSPRHSGNMLKHIDVPKDAKCPICGMFVAKYPKWVTLMRDSKGNTLYFDGVKDMMKYYFNHKGENFDPMLVQDFYTLKPVNAKQAWFVIGSNIYGPMGEELIPFRSQADAKTFAKEHFGKKIIRFDEIREDYLY
jgi:nitrous oxide reductase accessory protein NosL